MHAIVLTVSYFRYLDVDFPITRHWKPLVVGIAAESILGVISHEDVLVITDPIRDDRYLDILWVSSWAVTKINTSVHEHFGSIRWNGRRGQVKGGCGFLKVKDTKLQLGYGSVFSLNSNISTECEVTIFFQLDYYSN